MKEILFVSSCLGGNNCKYSGGNNYCKDLEKLKEKYDLVFFCPESMGGLPIPRVPSEIIKDQVLSKTGTDVTREFNRGARLALLLLNKYCCKKALLKEKSPSCGVKYIYDGTFTGTLIEGSGVTCQLFKDNGISVYSENQIEELI